MRFDTTLTILEGQGDQLGTLRLVVNVIVLWNTIYIDAILNQLRQDF
ncbi:MAG TPA: Tn3 family transposase [Waddliaceae bacterium]